MFYEIGVLQKSTRASLFLVKLQFFTLVQVTLAQVFYHEFCEVFKSTFIIKTSGRQPLNNTYSALPRASEFTLVLLQTKDSLSHSIFIAKETLFF